VTWPSDETSQFEFRLSRDLISEAASVSISCDVSLCRHNNDSSGDSIRSTGDAIPQV